MPLSSRRSCAARPEQRLSLTLGVAALMRLDGINYASTGAKQSGHRGNRSSELKNRSGVRESYSPAVSLASASAAVAMQRKLVDQLPDYIGGAQVA